MICTSCHGSRTVEVFLCGEGYVEEMCETCWGTGHLPLAPDVQRKKDEALAAMEERAARIAKDIVEQMCRAYEERQRNRSARGGTP